jgi:hypothetical protein
MRAARRIRLGMALAVLAASARVFGQAAILAPACPMVMISSKGLNAGTIQDGGEVVREIDDPHNGARWLLMRDSSHPGGPGRMVPGGEPRGKALNHVRKGAGTVTAQYQPGSAPVQPVIRAGDRLIVEENTAVAQAWLEAVALGPAAVGSPLDARLAIGGRVVRVVALAAGRAALPAETEARP